MTPQDIERIYDAMALQIDAVGPEKTPLYLAKLALLLSKELQHPEPVLDCIAAAAQSLDQGQN